MRSVTRTTSTADGRLPDRVGRSDSGNFFRNIRADIVIEKDLEKGFDYRKIHPRRNRRTGGLKDDGRSIYKKVLALDSSGLVASVAVVEE